MRKAISIMMMLLLVTGLVFAGGSKESAASSSTSSGKTVINIWTNDRHDAEYFNEKVAEFNASNPDIEIKITTVVEDYPNMLVMGYTSGNAPDLFYTSARSTGFDLKTFVDGGMLVPYPDEVLDDPEFSKVTDARNHIIEGINAIDGVPYGIYSVLRSGTRMIYNKDLLEQAGITELPTTLQELVDAAAAVTAVGNGNFYGIATCASAQFERWLEGICNKSGIYHYDYVNGRFDFSGFAEPLKLAQKFFSDGSMFPGSNSQGVDAMRAQFANGTFAIWGNASQEAGVFTDQFPISTFEWVVGELPSMDGEVYGAVEARPQKGLFMFSSCKNQDAAWEVVKYLNSEEFVKGYIEHGYALPLTEYMASIVDMSKIGRMADFALVPYEEMYPAAPAVTVAGDPYAVAIWNVIVSGGDVDKVLADLTKSYNDALDRDVKLGKVKRFIIEDYDPVHPSAGTIKYLDN